jgi:hypothetical protein
VDSGSTVLRREDSKGRRKSTENALLDEQEGGVYTRWSSSIVTYSNGDIGERE